MEGTTEGHYLWLEKAPLASKCTHGWTSCAQCNFNYPPANELANPKDAFGLQKVPLRLIPAPALARLAMVMQLGAAKYGAYNWRSKSVKFSVYLEAAMRHILSTLDGEMTDPESSQPHTAHAMACMAILLDAVESGNIINDLPTPGTFSKLVAELTSKKDSP